MIRTCVIVAVFVTAAWTSGLGPSFAQSETSNSEDTASIPAHRQILALLQDEIAEANSEKEALRSEILNQRRNDLEAERETFSAELEAFQTEDHPTSNPKINALASVQEGAIMTLGETTTEIKMVLNGPMSIIENSRQEGLRYLTYSPLKVSANILEAEELLAEDQSEEPQAEEPQAEDQAD